MTRTRIARGTSVLLLAPALLGGCEVVALSVDTGTGLIVVRLEDDDHRPHDPWRIRIRQEGVRNQVVALQPGEPLELTVAAAGPVELTLLAPPGCSTLGPNPRTVDPTPERRVTASFAVRCAP